MEAKWIHRPGPGISPQGILSPGRQSLLEFTKKLNAYHVLVPLHGLCHSGRMLKGSAPNFQRWHVGGGVCTPPPCSSPVPAGVSQLSSIQTLCIWRWVRSHRVRAQSYKTALYFRCQLSAHVVTGASDLLTIGQRFPQLSPWLQLIG